MNLKISAISDSSELYNVCSVHRGCSVHQGVFSTSGMFSTSGGVQYTGGYHEHIVQYIGGSSVHRRDTMSTLGDVQYIGVDIMMHVWDTKSTSGGYHEYIGANIMSTSGNVQYIGVFNRN